MSDTTLSGAQSPVLNKEMPVPSETEVDVTEKNSVFSEEYDAHDDKDPKNWSPSRKHLLFAALMFSSLLCDG